MGTKIEVVVSWMTDFVIYDSSCKEDSSKGNVISSDGNMQRYKMAYQVEHFQEHWAGKILCGDSFGQ